MKLTEALKQLLGLTAQVNEKLDKIAAAPAKPKAGAGADKKDGDPDDDEDDDECPDCDGTGKCATCEGSGKMEGEGAKHCSHTDALAKANESLKDASIKIDAQAKAIADLNAKLEAAQAQVNSLGSENAKLKTDLQTAKGATTRAIASVGIPAGSLPESPSNPSAKSDPWERYCALMDTDPRAAGQFYSQNKDDILKAREVAMAKGR